METDATYRKGYKQGVLDATKPVSDEKYGGGYQFAGTSVVEGPINSLLKDRRTQLLLRKTTKWINVAQSFANVSDPASVRWGYGTLYDDKVTAESNSWSLTGYIGTYPIEIEEPI